MTDYRFKSFRLASTENRVGQTYALYCSVNKVSSFRLETKSSRVKPPAQGWVNFPVPSRASLTDLQMKSFLFNILGSDSKVFRRLPCCSFRHSARLSHHGYVRQGRFNSQSSFPCPRRRSNKGRYQRAGKPGRRD